MSNYQKLASDLMAALELSLPPVAVSFCDEAPANVASFDDIAAGAAFSGSTRRPTALLHPPRTMSFVRSVCTPTTCPALLNLNQPSFATRCRP